MKRIRLSMIFAVLAVMAIGVQTVHAVCPSSMTLYYESGRFDCQLTARNSDYSCDYSCIFYRIYFT